MTSKETVTDLSPDGFSRFFIIADILQQIYGGAKRRLRILDVGGGSEFFAQQLKKVGLDCELTILDLIERPAAIRGTYIQADATNTNLPDNSYDVVVSTDTLEHIPNDRKQAFVDECLRVASELCIVAAPFETAGVDAAERTINDFNKKLFGSGQSWLEEHLQYGKPTLELFTKTLKRRRIAFDHFGTQPLTTWLLNTQTNLVDAKLGLDKRAHRRTNVFYNQNILEMGECKEPTYRHVFVVYLDPVAQKRCDIGRYVSAPTDYKKTAQYLNMLVDLFAERIASLGADNQELAAGLEAATNSLAAAEETNLRQSALLEEQSVTIQKLEPLQRFVGKQPMKTVAHVVRKLTKD